MDEWKIDWRNGYVDELLEEWISKEGDNEWMDDQITGWMGGWMDCEWVGGWVDGWMSGCGWVD